MIMFGKKVRAGLDIGAFGLKYAAVEARSQHCYVWHGVMFPDRETQYQELKTREQADRVRELLEQAQAAVPTWTRAVSVNMQGESVQCGYLELPRLSAKEAELAVVSALHRELPFPVEHSHVATVPVTPLAPAPNKVAVFYTAIKKTAAAQCRKLLEYCDLTLRSLEVTAVALCREFELNHQLQPGAFYALVHVGFEYTQVVVVRDGMPYYLRDFPLAGKHFTYAFQMATQISWSKAEQYKLDYKIGAKDFAIEPFLQDWTEEVQRSLEHFASRHPDGHVSYEGIYLSGGSAGWRGLDARLQQSLGVAVTLDGWDRFEAATGSDGGDDAVTYKVALGLALGQ